MSALLLACVVVYLLIAVEVFKTDKTELIYDLNRSMVSNLSVELETQLKGVSDKFRLYALLSSDPQQKYINENIFGNDSDVVFASLYKQNQSKTLREFSNTKYLETYGLQTTYFNEVLQAKKPVPFEQILKSGEYLWNASVENGIPLIGYGRSVVVEDAKGQPTEHLTVVGYMKVDKILKILNTAKLAETAVVDSLGNILLHPNIDIMNSERTYTDNPLYKTALESKINLSVASLTDSEGEFLGAFAKTFQGKIFVLTRASKSHAFSAVYELVSRSLSFALIVITVSLLFAFLLSRSLTKPISVLVDGMEQVSSGNLTTQIEVKSKDETQMLANSFNQMIRDLKKSRDELEQINRELDQKVKDRTRQLEIQNQAVKDAQEALIKTTRLASAGEIAGRAAHEVLNPLTGILTRLSAIDKKVQTQYEPHLNLMKDIFKSWNNDYTNGGMAALTQAWQSKSEVNPDWNLWNEDISNLGTIQKTFQEMISSLTADTQFLISESQRINKIVSGMRKLSSLSSDVKSYSIKRLLVDCRNIMADLFNQQNIQIVEDYTVDKDQIDIDRDEFIQAVTNLMRNSLQSMVEARSSGVSTKEPLHLKISTFQEDQNICIEIADNGSGIPDEFQKFLFEKQFSTKSPDEGTGLGLGISRRFIRAHNGDIEFISSVPYLETKFRIILPLKTNNSKAIEKGAA